MTHQTVEHAFPSLAAEHLFGDSSSLSAAVE